MPISVNSSGAKLAGPQPAALAPQAFRSVGVLPLLSLPVLGRPESTDDVAEMRTVAEGVRPLEHAVAAAATGQESGRPSAAAGRRSAARTRASSSIEPNGLVR